MSAAMRLLGFDSWQVVADLARQQGHKVAVELLARRVERSL